MFPGHFFFLRSAPLCVTLMMDKAPEHCKMFPGPFVHLRSVPLHVTL